MEKLLNHITLSFCVLFLVFGLKNTSAQGSLKIGQWRSHLPYQAGRMVTQSDDRVFYATEWSVVVIDKADDAIEFLSKVDGLSNTGIQLIRYNRGSDVLIIVYTNSVIDLVKPSGVITMNQIRNFDNIIGEKQINDIFIETDSTAFLAASYGVSKINTNRNEFAFTTFMGIEVEAVTRYNGFIYAATSEGIYRASVDNFNLEDFGQWEFLDTEEGFPGIYTTRSMAVYNDELYADINDTIFVISQNPIQRFHHEPGHQIRFMSAEGVHLLVGARCISGGCSGDKGLFFAPGDISGELSPACIGQINYAIEDETGRVWYGDNFRGFRRTNSVSESFCDSRIFNSPWSESSRELTIRNNELWLAAGGVNQTFSNRFLDHGFASFIDGQWTIFNRNTRDALKGPLQNDGIDDLLDFMAVAIHPSNGKVYAGSFYEGLIEFDGENFVQFDENNSSLGNAVGDPLRTRVGGLAFDEEENLWVTNHSAESPLSVLQPDGTWRAFAPACRQEEIHQIAIDQSGFKWMVVNTSAAGVIVFDEGIIDDPTDDRCKTFTSSNSELPTNNTNCVTVDLDGDVWVGTNEGVVIFECGGSVFENICVGFRKIVEQDGFGAFLLETENVQTIAVDGANRKWIGTQNGVFVLSPNGEEQIAHFTVDNSPLFDNGIIDITINPLNGEAFIGTNKGVISYKGEAIEGQRVNSAEIQVFPNPVRPEYDGPIAIRGLARDANVKITDIRGRLVFETTALGGQAIWDGRDYNGRRADSGVYLVFSTSSSRFTGFTANPDGAVARILLLK